MPFPPRFWSLNSLMAVFLPIPISDTNKSTPSSSATCMPMTLSPSERFIPFTPMETLPVALASFSSKRMHWPFLEIIKISFLPSVTWTSISSSPSRRLIAARPTLRIFAYSDRLVLFIIPSLVAIVRYPDSYPSFRRIDVTFSPACNCSRLMTAVPLAIRLASGIS